MKLEILHDVLAKQVFEKASTDDRMRLKVESFLLSRYASYQERGGLLSGKDLNYIQPYLRELNLERPVKKFIQRSRWKARTRTLLITGLVLVAFVTLALFYIRSEQLVATKERNSIKMRQSLEEAKRLNALYTEEKNRRERLEAQAEDTQELLALSKEELAEIAHELELKNKELEEAYKLLTDRTQRVEKENKKVKQSYAAVVKEQKKQEKALSQAEQRRQQLLTDYVAAESRGALAGDNKELAFRLARAAIERDPKNEEAQQVLFHLEKPAASYPYKGMPPNHSSPEAIIQKLDARYGALTNAQKRKYGLLD